ncbi:MAG: hypothetical protein ACMUEL_08930 [Flavobacteriales bacterium Tduv]
MLPRGSYLRTVESKGRGTKGNQSKKRKDKKETESGVYIQGIWLKKSGKFYYGYKKHIIGGGIKIK